MKIKKLLAWMVQPVVSWKARFANWLKLDLDRSVNQHLLSRSKIGLIIAAFFVAIGWTILLPGRVAYESGVYTKRQVVDILTTKYSATPINHKRGEFMPESAREVLHLRELLSFESNRASTRQKLMTRWSSEMKHLSFNPAKNDSISNTDSLLTRLGHPFMDSSKLSAVTKWQKIEFSGFAENIAKYTWLANTFAMLSLIILIFSHTEESGISHEALFKEMFRWFWPGKWKIFFISITLFCAIEGLHQLQKIFILDGLEGGRTQFTYVNPDISIWSFILEEFRTFFFFVEYVVLIMVSNRDSELVEKELESERTIPEILNSAGIHFQRWQIHSIGLAAAFLPWTYFFWSSIKGHGDVRFAYVGFCLHLMWGFAWVMISAPVLKTMRGWSMQRLELADHYMFKNMPIGKSISSPTETIDIDAAKYYLELSPVSSMKLIFSSIIAVFSFLLPVIEAIK